ncbi:bifunctional oligoribonuclease/PAP phosphatase NrnA [Capnocytophaga sp.]|uniref:DHH family phosphoesterase n=1 Tax=Capnocytophaga sp. TaxID=44737 RepID=UPI0026DD49DC|nr:bifunctional oligoribonuclease/PAP phosphatase NrnA [Capnocytophaga sp.]MDO5106192.1 bifunctional oligoribonuclease/PAP phosphatase NrnA [Capnocytophaga sp.]
MNIYEIESAKLLLEKQLKISIIPHKNPDGDAIGSCLGLYHYLKQHNLDVTVVSPNDFPEYLKWLPESDKILIYDHNPQQATRQIEASKLIFTLDFNSLKRADSLTPILEASKAKFIMIDHHQAPESYAEITFSNPKASSTCAMVYSFIDAMGDKNCINETIATCLYTGIMTDTGNFKYPSTTNNTFKIASFLIEKGADNSQINSNVFDNNSFDKLQLLSVALNNMVYLKDYNTAYTTLSTNELLKHNCQKGDTDGFVNYGLTIKNTKLAVIFIQENDYVKISFRSKNQHDVNAFARTYFNGGGHINAAGGKFDGTIEQAVAFFLEVLPKFQ